MAASQRAIVAAGRGHPATFAAMAVSPRHLLLGAAACAVAFLVLLGLAYGSDWARWVDAVSLQGFLGLQGPTTSPWAVRAVQLGDPGPVALTGAALALVAIVRGQPRHALVVVALVALTSVSSQVLKALLAYPRYESAAGFSFVGPEAFPSGHATAAMTLAIALVIVVPRALRPAAALVGGAFAVGVSFSIVALGWHFPSDVVGGYLLATGWAFVLLAGLRASQIRFPERHVRSRLAERSDALTAATAVGGLLVAFVGLALLATKLPELTQYAREHTAFAAVAGAVSLSALTLLAALTGALSRRS
jgi:membrane-associated phospholipid phosphatase